MGRVSRPGPLRGGPGRERILVVVNSLVKDENRKQAYLAFAQELVHAERASYSVRGSPMRKLGTVPRSACVELGAVQSPFSRRTKRVVQKYFGRGLHGNLLWLIGQEVLRWT